MGIKGVILENHGHISPGWREFVDQTGINMDLSGRNLLQTGYYPKEGGFTTARGAKNGQEAPLRDQKIYLHQGPYLTGIDLAYPF